MGDFIFKLSGPQRAMEVQVPMSKGVGELDMVRKLIGKQIDCADEDSVKKGKKKKSQKNTHNDYDTATKIGVSTFGALLASVILSAMKDDSR